RFSRFPCRCHRRTRARVGATRVERHRELQIPLFVGNMDGRGVNTSAVPAGMVLLPAQGSVADAWTRLGAAVAERGLTVFARIDFAADAAAVGMHLRPTRLLVFGNPRAGTPLLAAAPTVGIDLPLKLLIWEDAQGRVA